MPDIIFRPIGTISTPFKEPRGTPIQPRAARGAPGTVQVFPEYREGLQDLEGFSHIFLIYHFHLSRDFTLKVKPFLDDEMRGVFATRAPSRPNPIGVSLVRLEGVQGDRLEVLDVDMVDGTPLLDIKPYVPQFDYGPEARIGWIEKNLEKLRSARDDGRFSA
ncbi:MAG: tRNA (N6-threonylcarbamoyladenosine(37)-N6)-methyltransferase TrmO [Thermodesulfobacteriota bacterium]